MRQFGGRSGQPPKRRQREGGEHNARLVAHSGDKRREAGRGGPIRQCYGRLL
jgi:hypothetical protein